MNKMLTIPECIAHWKSVYDRCMAYCLQNNIDPTNDAETQHSLEELLFWQAEAIKATLCLKTYQLTEAEVKIIEELRQDKINKLMGEIEDNYKLLPKELDEQAYQAHQAKLEHKDE